MIGILHAPRDGTERDGEKGANGNGDEKGQGEAAKGLLGHFSAGGEIGMSEHHGHN